MADIVDRVAMLAVDRGQSVTNETIEALSAIASQRDRSRDVDESDVAVSPELGALREIREASRDEVVEAVKAPSMMSPRRAGEP